jgi:hypothetical protein
MTDYVYGPPTDGKPFKLAMGLRSLELENWLEDGPDLANQLMERAELIKNSPEIVYGEIAGHSTEISYFVAAIMSNLRKYHDKTYVFHGSQIIHQATGLTAELTARNPLLELARVIAEDLCVLKKIRGEWTMIAGAVLFPSRWRLDEKLGKNIDQIHTPVPGYTDGLQPYMGPTFDKLIAGRAMWRKNWSLHSTPDLHQPTAIHAAVNPSDFWWRTERQTLTRSSDSETILFTIRNRSEPLSWILARPEESLAFAQTLASMSPQTVEYKGLTDDLQEIVRTLQGTHGVQ